MYVTKQFVWLLAILVLLGGCSSRAGNVYSRGEARQVLEVDFGTIETIRDVIIEGNRSLVGAGTGAVLGGVAGSGVGQGRGSVVAGVAGAVIGGVIGAATEEGVTRKPGFEITVRLERDNRVIAVVQEANEGDVFSIGQRVRVLTDGMATRVAP